MKQILRVSDARSPITVLNATKEDCILNFIKTFGLTDAVIIADKCEDKTLSFLTTMGFSDVRKTSLGKIGSFKYALEIATHEWNDDEVVYLCEDDFIHRPYAKAILEEGLKYQFASGGYISLYDCLDKYFKQGPNPYINANYEIVKLLVSPSTHWKSTVSSKFVVATKVGTLKDDVESITKHITANSFDFVEASVDLIITKNREFLIPIPGYATECCNLATPFVNWSALLENTVM